jgi:uncharacterized LabA/DUF88 family protein
MRGIIYLDLDNFPASTQYEKALEEFYQKDLRILSKKAFGDLDQLLKLPLEIQQSHSLIPCPKLTKTKNSTDMRLSVEIMKDLLTNPSIDIFIICSADTDYIPVMKEVKEHGKEVIILTNSNGNLNPALTDTADQIIVCESTKPKRDKHSRAKIQELLGKIFGKSKEKHVPISGINDYFVNNGYNFKTYGYTSFRQCMEQCIDKKKYEIDFNSGLLILA